MMKSLRQSAEGSRSSYDLTVPPVVRFGHGRIAEVGHIAAILGKRIWLVVGKQVFLADPLGQLRHWDGGSGAGSR